MKDDKRNIDDLINESFNSNEEEFDFSSWNEVKDQLEQSASVDHLVKSAFHLAVEDVPASGWEHVNDGLDIETVWNRLADGDNRRPVAFWWNVAAIGLLLIGIGYVLFQSGIFENEASPESIVTTDRSLQPISSYGVNVDIDKGSMSFDHSQGLEDSIASLGGGSYSYAESFEENDSSAEASFVLVENGNVLSSSEGSVSVIEENEAPFQDNFEFNPLRFSIPPIPNIENGVMLQLVEVFSLKDSADYVAEQSNQEVKKWNIGLVSSFDNTWVMDVNTREGMRRNSLVFNEESFAPSFGVYGSYLINNKYAVSSELFLINSQRNKNNLYINGNLNLKETTLEYVKSTWLLDRKIMVNPYTPDRSVILSGGAYVSFLKRNMIKNNGIITSINADYKNYDIGAKVNLAFQREYGPLTLNVGTHLDYGLINIYKGSAKLPAYLNQTRNISWGVVAKLGYNF